MKELNVTPRKILSHIVKGSFLIKRFWFVQVVFGNSLYHAGGMQEPNERAFSPHRLFSFMRFYVTLIVVLVVAGHASADLECHSEESRPGLEQTERVQTTQPALSQGEWFKITVQESGIYKLDRSLLLTAGVTPDAFMNIESFRIFGNGGQPLPEDILVPRPAGLQEVRRMVVDRNGNGAFDAEDLILFFGTGPIRWRYTAGSGFSHAINPYSDHNAYFVTFGGAAGRAMDSVASLTTPSPFVLGDVGGMEFVEEEKVNLLNSGREWYGEVLNSQAPARTYSTILPGIDASKPVVYRVAVLGRTDRTEAFVVSENGQTLGNPIAIYPVIIGSLESNYAYVAPVTSYARTGLVTGEKSNLRFEFQTAKGEGWVNWFEIFYRRKPEAVNDVLMFPTPDTTAVTEFRLSGFNSDQTMVFDVTRHDSVVRIVNLQFDQVDPGKCTFQYSHTAGDVRTLLAAGPSAWKIPLSIARVENSSLRSSTGGAEFVIINPAEFAAEAERLRQYRIQRDSIMTTVVSVESIMNEFGGGLMDPIAIRDFLAHARATWTVAPKYVLLFGDGHYDYRGLVSSRRNWIPPYESAESIHQIQTYASDDILARLVAGEQRTSLAIGRLPVGSVGEARNAVDKILAYGTTAPFGSWRNRVTFVADDGLTSTGDDGSLHTSQADALSRFYTPEDVEKKKIYIVEYPTINSSSGRRKPAANEAIVRAINEGTLILNYTGHGNPDVWAHEAVFTRDGSLPLLKNGDNLFLLVAATCDFARYDQPDETSAGELLITMGKSGAIAVVTASRAVYSLDNLQFNNTLFTELFRREADGRPSRIGDAFFRTKQIHYSLNDLKYHLLGDPTMRLNLPFHTGRIDSLKGGPTTTPVQLRALEKVVVSGGVWKADGNPWTDFSGTALLEVFDARRIVIVPEWNNFQFEVTGSLLFRGEVSLRDGRYGATVPIPKDISYEPRSGRIAFYAWGSSGDAAGYTENVIIAGSDSAAAPDTVGPTITVFLGDEYFRSGDMVPPNPDLIVRLFDENGINTSTAGVGHRLEASFSATGESITLNAYYKGNLDTYQSGEIRYPVNSLPEGRQRLTVTAWDTYNNAASEQVWFEVRAASDVDVYNALNIPNPFARSTTFTFQRSSSRPVDVEIRVYAISGRLIASMQMSAVTDRFVAIPWDGRDQNGDQISNGVYFYKIITRDMQSMNTREVIGKLARLQ